MTRVFWGGAALVAAWSVVALPSGVTAQSATGEANDAEAATTAADVTADAAQATADRASSDEQSSTTTSDASADAQVDSAANADASVTAANDTTTATTDTTTDIATDDATPPADPSPTDSASASVSENADVDATAQPNANTAVQPNARVGAQGNVDVESQRLNAGVAADVDAATNVDASGTAVNNQPSNVAVQRATSGLQFDRAATGRGLIVNTVDQQSFFYQAGLRQGDVIVSYGGRAIRTPAELGRWVLYQPGERVPVVVLRDGRQETIYVTYRAPQPGADDLSYPRAAAQPYLGIALDQDSHGAVIQAVNPGSPAEQAGLQAGDVILSLNGRGVTSWREVPLIVATMQAGDPLDIVFSRPVEQRVVATLGIRNVDAAVAVQAVPAEPPSVRATYVEPAVPAPAPAVVAPATRVAPAPAQVVPPRRIENRIDGERDDRILDGDRRPLRD
jgi:hypothetical protein